MDRTNPKMPRELARYFLSTRTLLDMKFNANSGRFEPRGRFTNPTSNAPSNQKLKLRRLRRETRHIQRKVHEYQNRCQKRGITSPGEKYKFNSLKRTLSALWDRIRHCNEELVHLLNHVIMELAKYHNVSEINFENLKWSRHSRKSKAGKYLAFWQAHWFFSQVQETVKLQAFLHRIRFKRVNAAYTSKTCSECGARGALSGKLFTCGKTESHRRGRIIELQSDLNAARNIALA
jgi:transposase